MGCSKQGGSVQHGVYGKAWNCHLDGAEVESISPNRTGRDWKRRRTTNHEPRVCVCACRLPMLEWVGIGLVRDFAL